MKKGTSILVDSFLCIHQILIGNIVLMKRESKPVCLFFFGEYSDEWLMRHTALSASVLMSFFIKSSVFHSHTNP